MPSRLVGCLVALLLAGATLGGCGLADGPTPTAPATIAPAPTAIPAAPSATPPRTVSPASPTSAPTAVPTAVPTRAATVTVMAPTVPPPAPTAASGQPPALGEPFVLRPGQGAAVVDGPRIAFTDVPEDSRCPTMVNCVWVGRAVLSLEASIAGQPPATLSLATKHSPEPTDRATYGGYEIRLASVQPRRARPDDPMPLGDYRAELVVIRVE